ncbi:MAG TPA: isoprenylcysteine carboxylmethyltransferase family protein [Myxococcota bacterium]|nr:isoprenylcysteine carboxylmethyltransferase family protein [Myxococcota bacterium]
MVWLRTLIFTVVVPATVTVYVPRWILSRAAAPGPAGWRWIALLPMAAGVAIYLRCAFDFGRARGTPAPIDPPKDLVAVGLYRYTRNPMYVGVASIVWGEALLFASWGLAGFAAAVCIVFHAFVVLYEEPSLRGRFGEAYARYCSAVPRWLPRPRWP